MEVTTIVVSANSALLAGLIFSAGRYVQRLSDVEKKVQDILGQKNEVAQAVFKAQLDHLVESVEIIRKEVNWLAESWTLRNNRVEANGSD